MTIPQREDPRLEKLAKRCESCRPMGMFRSADDEFLLCYDGGHDLITRSQFHLTYYSQNLDSTSTNTVTQVDPQALLNGKALQNMSHSIHHIFCFSTPDSSRSVMLRLADLLRLSQAMMFVVSGTVGDSIPILLHQE